MQIEAEGSIAVALCEGDHHWGVGALLNSLVSSGFKGQIVVGYRGVLPPWCDAKSERGGWELSPGVVLEMVAVEPNVHLARYKAAFMARLFEGRPEVRRCFYFDTDIVVTGEWSTFEEWANDGLALVAHAWPLSSHHPHRHAWAEFGKRVGLSVRREMSEYINSGFVGISRCDLELLNSWQRILEALGEEGVDLGRFQHLPSANPWKLTDQAALNLVAMTTDRRLSIMDASAMDFSPFGYMMSHAAGPTKPWRFGYVRSALRGRIPQKSLHEWVSYIESPIRLYSMSQIRWIRFSLKVADVLGRVYRHPMSSYYSP